MERSLARQIRKAARSFPAVLLTGPRQCGKTTLLRHLFPKIAYVLLEEPDVIARVQADPRGFLDDLSTPVILDEIQNAPALLSYVRARIDAAPRRRGQWILTGSQEAPLMRGVSESMAGRAAVLQLLPMSIRESAKVDLLRGGYPGVLDRPAAADLWFRSYIQTYLERDVRGVTGVKNLGTFRRFLALLASRHGNILNRTDLAAPLGVSVPTVSEWLNALEITGQVLLVRPYFENFGKRVLKSPKVYFIDSGLVCHLLGIDTSSGLRRSPMYGPLFEGFVAAEIAKLQLGAGRRLELYYFRDQQGLEVDFIVPRKAGTLMLVEAKATRTPTPAMTKSIQRLRASMKRYKTAGVLVHAGNDATYAGRTIAPSITALSLTALLDLLD